MVIWAVCALGPSTLSWDVRLLVALISTSIFLCLCISIICHATIYKMMRRHRLQIHSQIQAFEDTNTRTSMASLRKSAFNAFVVFIVLVICYFPYLVVSTVDIIDNVADITLGLLLSSTVVSLNSALNHYFTAGEYVRVDFQCCRRSAGLSQGNKSQNTVISELKHATFLSNRQQP